MSTSQSSRPPAMAADGSTAFRVVQAKLSNLQLATRNNLQSRNDNSFRFLFFSDGPPLFWPSLTPVSPPLSLPSSLFPLPSQSPSPLHLSDRVQFSIIAYDTHYEPFVNHCVSYQGTTSLHLTSVMVQPAPVMCLPNSPGFGGVSVSLLLLVTVSSFLR